MLQPGTSASFMMVDKVTPDKTIQALAQYGGRILQCSLSNDAQQQLQQACGRFQRRLPGAGGHPRRGHVSSLRSLVCACALAGALVAGAGGG